MNRKLIALVGVVLMPSIGGCDSSTPDISQWIVRNWLCGKMVMAVENDHSYKVAYYDMNDNFSYSAVGYYSISGSDITFTDRANRVVGGDVSHTMRVTSYFPPTDDTSPKMIYESSGMKDLECVGVRLKQSIPDPL